MSLATMQHPLAIASATTSGCPSWYDGASECGGVVVEQRDDRRDPGSRGTGCARRRARPALRARARSRCRAAGAPPPSRGRRRRRSRRSRTSASWAAIATSTPFSGTRRPTTTKYRPGRRPSSASVATGAGSGRVTPFDTTTVREARACRCRRSSFSACDTASSASEKRTAAHSQYRRNQRVNAAPLRVLPLDAVRGGDDPASAQLRAACRTPTTRTSGSARRRSRRAVAARAAASA